MRTAITAMGLAGAGFIVPFMFVYDPALLLAASPVTILISTGTGVLGLTALAAAAVGFTTRPLAGWQRGLLAVGAVSLLTPVLVVDAIGGAIVAFVVAAQKGNKGVPSVT